MRFTNKIVLITGASRGIGAKSATEFAKEGATVIINYLNDEKSALEVLESCNNQGSIFKADVSKEEDVGKLFSFIEDKYGKLDVLVNNAGIVKVCPIKDLSLEQWNKTHEVNLTSIFLCTKKAMSIMNKGGSIVNISSIRGLFDFGRPPILDYSSSKAAVISLTKTFSKELAPDIRVNCVGPGMTNTDIAKTLPKESIEQFKKDIYLGRLIEPIEVARSILFLSSDEASGITGAVLMVDGGQSLS